LLKGTQKPGQSPELYSTSTTETKIKYTGSAYQKAVNLMIREYEARTSSQYCFVQTVTASFSKCSNLTSFCCFHEFK